MARAPPPPLAPPPQWRGSVTPRDSCPAAAPRPPPPPPPPGGCSAGSCPGTGRGGRGRLRGSGARHRGRGPAFVSRSGAGRISTAPGAEPESGVRFSRSGGTNPSTPPAPPHHPPLPIEGAAGRSRSSRLRPVSFQAVPAGGGPRRYRCPRGSSPVLRRRLGRCPPPHPPPHPSTPLPTPRRPVPPHTCVRAPPALCLGPATGPAPPPRHPGAVCVPRYGPGRG